MTLVYASLVVIDASIAITSAIQLLRFYAQNQTAGWTRQKVFHCMIGVSNCGFTVYFILDAIAACQGWTCWPNVCGFLAAAAPQIMFLATFLFLLSFCSTGWICAAKQLIGMRKKMMTKKAFSSVVSYLRSYPVEPMTSIENGLYHSSNGEFMADKRLWSWWSQSSPW
jgi:hypothetical protein